MREFLRFFVLQALNFVLLVTNIRAIAHTQYAWAVLTDGLICLVTWTLVKEISAAHGWRSRAGYICGGMVGSFVGIWVTRAWG